MIFPGETSDFELIDLQEVEIERNLCSPAFKSHLGSQSDDSVKDSGKKDKETPFDKISSESSHSHTFEVTAGPTKPASVFAEDTAVQSKSVSDLQEVVSLKERMARYQAAVSRGDCRSFSANMLEESEMCTVPGGLARVKKQFEKDKSASSSNTFTQYQYQHQNRSEQIKLKHYSAAYFDEFSVCLKSSKIE
ncbi:hypothetical protein MG293_004397 [Ovis ammon polii]|uniref:Uncharacterized protein n=1 Tax=Ovis ammon polii TaxID=230172 RepID=A0AAD4UDL4_OVIAM|nr:hypothetical protein MG293_004397 [Ovis ammon polii]